MTDVMSVGYVYFRQNRQGLGGRSIFGITKWDYKSRTYAKNPVFEKNRAHLGEISQQSPAVFFLHCVILPSRVKTPSKTVPDHQGRVSPTTIVEN